MTKTTEILSTLLESKANVKKFVNLSTKFSALEEAFATVQSSVEQNT